MNSLSGMSVLVLEDNPVLSTDLCFLIEDAGATVVGPFRTLRDGLRSVSSHHVDCAILDVELLDGKSFPIAGILEKEGVPFLFYSAKGSSGYEAAKLHGAPILSKSHSSRDALDYLANLIR